MGLLDGTSILATRPKPSAKPKRLPADAPRITSPPSRTGNISEGATSSRADLYPTTVTSLKTDKNKNTNTGTNTGAGAGDGHDRGDTFTDGFFPGTGVELGGPEGVGGSLSALEAQSILDAIAAIEAQTGLTREQLMNEQSEIGRQYRMYNAVAERQHAQNQEAIQNGAVERGLGRSGIHADQQGELLQQFIEFQNQQAAAQNAQLAQIDVSLQQADLTDRTAKAQAIQDRAGATLDLEAIRAAATGGL